MDSMNQVPMQAPKKSAGPLVGIVIIIIVLILGALYFYGSKLNQQPTQSTTESPSELATSDETADIAKDLTASTINGVDSELKIIEQEINTP